MPGSPRGWMLPFGALVLLGALQAAPALARDRVDEASPVISPSGGVTLQVLMNHPAALIKHYLSNASTTIRLSPEVLDVQSSPKGACDQVSVQTKGMFSPLTYVVMRCPTSKGYTERLLQSEDFDAQEVEWSVEEVEGGSQVTLKVHTEPRIPLPAAALRAVLVGSMRATLRKLDKEVEADEPASQP